MCILFDSLPQQTESLPHRIQMAAQGEKIPVADVTLQFRIAANAHEQKRYDEARQALTAVAKAICCGNDELLAYYLGKIKAYDGSSKAVFDTMREACRLCFIKI